MGRIVSALAVAVAAGVAPAAPATAAPPAAAGARTATVTLITGDVVQLSTDRYGQESVTVRRGAATGNGGFSTARYDGHTYVVPDVAAPSVSTGRLDRALFDVTALVADGYDDAHAAALPLIVQGRA